jgi:hypothetical protein
MGCALIWFEMASVVSIDYVHDFALSSDGLNEASKQAKRCSRSLGVGYLFRNVECKDNEQDVGEPNRLGGHKRTTQEEYAGALHNSKPTNGL